MRIYLLDIPTLVVGDAEATVGAVGSVAVAREPRDEARLHEAASSALGYRNKHVEGTLIPSLSGSRSGCRSPG